MDTKEIAQRQVNYHKNSKKESTEEAILSACIEQSKKIRKITDQLNFEGKIFTELSELYKKELEKNHKKSTNTPF